MDISKIFKKYNIPKQISITTHQAEEGGYWLDSKDLPGLYTQGETLDETFKNLEDAILTYFDVPRKEAKKIPKFLSVKEDVQVRFGERIGSNSSKSKDKEFALVG